MAILIPLTFALGAFCLLALFRSAVYALPLALTLAAAIGVQAAGGSSTLVICTAIAAFVGSIAAARFAYILARPRWVRRSIAALVSLPAALAGGSTAAMITGAGLGGAALASLAGLACAALAVRDLTAPRT